MNGDRLGSDQVARTVTRVVAICEGENYAGRFNAD